MSHATSKFAGTAAFARARAAAVHHRARGPKPPEEPLLHTAAARRDFRKFRRALMEAEAWSFAGVWDL